MSPLCLVCGCSEDEVIKMHYFPKNSVKCSLWFAGLGLPYLGGVTRNSRICNKHFKQTDYVNNIIWTLKRDALPMKFVDRQTTRNDTDLLSKDIKREMVISCWAPECTHNSLKDPCKFFTFPCIPTRRKRWLQLIRRDGIPGIGELMCSCHFRDGNEVNDPEIFAHNEQKLFKEHYLSQEYTTMRKNAKRKLDISHENTEVIDGYSSQDEPMVSPSTSEPMPGPSKREPMPGPPIRELIPGSSTKEADIIMLKAENDRLKLEVEKSKEIIRTMRLHFSYTHICENDALILEYTGLPNRKIYESLLFVLQDLDIKYYLERKVEKLNLQDQILIALMKLRHNFTHTDLAYRFNVSTATITNVVVTFIHLFHDVLFVKLMGRIPKHSKNRSCLPNCANTFTNCRIILDCTEVFSAVPQHLMKHQKIAYSANTHRSTLKALVGVAPNGVITYASNLFPGSTSDKIIVKSCEILDQMEPGDLILTAKGLLIKDILPNGVTVNAPPYLSTEQITPEQVRRIECIARATIHVERAIKRMKSYKILSFIPAEMFKYSTIIFKTVAALTNLQYPLIKEVSQFYTDSEIKS